LPSAWRYWSAGGPAKEAPSTNRNAPLLVAVVIVSVLLIVILTFSVPRKEPERKGPAEVKVIIDFNGYGPGQNSTSRIWKLDSLVFTSGQWGVVFLRSAIGFQNETNATGSVTESKSEIDSNYSIVKFIHDEKLDWGIQLKLDNSTVYQALERASQVANFTFKSEWYPNFRSHRVNEIAGVRDGTDNRFWQYHVNGRYMGTGADLTALSDGDVVRWEFRSALQ